MDTQTHQTLFLTHPYNKILGPQLEYPCTFHKQLLINKIIN